ncbi:MAG: glycosyltransferase [Gomphosphaeria aponina SAG 52.96 = DSM 107014]|uniref:Glycosyltransferase n=1 Tax=Gomphosphaeria aponina SAG 52.96 = DSM 107014 TaxID=1521640 RepID=A0A941JUL0_9CHRO|nr:glycosyltransferase [Gomphosphaeria aponina SAG 52.96 = DSM 107014]
MIILHIAPIIHNKISGLTFCIPALVNALHRQGIVTAMLTTESLGRYETPQPYPVFYLQDFPLYQAISALPPPFNQPNLIVFHGVYFFTHALLAAQARVLGIPYIITPHSSLTQRAQQVKPRKKIIGNWLIFKRVIKNAAAIHCLTENEGIDAQKWHKSVFVVGNGVELPPEKTVIKNNLNFGFLGRLDIYQKGLDLLLEAAAISKEQLSQAQVKINLYGPDKSGSKETLKKLINKYQIEDLVLIKEPVWGAEKEQVLQETNLFLHTSRFEGQPMAILEALADSLPCLLTPGTNVAEEVVNAGAGWAVGETPQAIAAGLCQVIAKKNQLTAKGKAARKLVESKYTWEKIGVQTLREYMQVI